MRRAPLLFVLSIVGLAVLTACPSKPKNGECKTGQDCLEQEGYGKVCVEGRCQECAADADCMAGFICRSNKCVPKPQCLADADCGPDQECVAEKCVAKPPPPPPAEPPKPAIPPECADSAAFTIRFDFDKSTLRADSQGTLQTLADCLRRAPASRVVIEGHCDDRGTTQYNIALGNRRAEAARKYLSDLGAAVRLETVSYGEERPICTQATEDCWQRNRRADFQVER